MDNIQIQAEFDYGDILEHCYQQDVLVGTSSANST